VTTAGVVVGNALDTDGVDAFVWPPREADAPVVVDRPVDPGLEREIAPSGAAPGWWGRAEADLLGVRSVSFSRWARATGWRADGFGSFCWRCADSVGAYEVDGTGCGTCRERRLAWDRAARLGVYEGGLRAAVMELKFGKWRRTGAELGAALGDRLKDVMDAGGFGAGEVVVVPVPTSWRRRMERGIDHTGVLAAAAGREAGVRVVRGLGRRHTPAQVGLSATARAANIRGAFRVRTALGRLEGVRAVVVLDDVRTTGATMTAACRSVRGVIGRQVEIWALTVLVATDRRGPASGLVSASFLGSGAGVGAGTARGGAGSGGVFGGEREKIAKSFELAV